MAGNYFHASRLWAASPPAAGQQPATAASSPIDDREDQIVANYLKDCGGTTPKNVNCDKLRNDFVAILQEDLLTLGSTADRQYLPDIVRMFRTRPEVELRIAAAHAIGMIEPQDSDLGMLIPLTNDPVPDVRHAVSNMSPKEKGNTVNTETAGSAHAQWPEPLKSGEDAAKFSMPVAPDSVYLFDSSDATKGRLSYVSKGKSDPGAFFKGKARKVPTNGRSSANCIVISYKMKKNPSINHSWAAAKQLENQKPP